VTAQAMTAQAMTAQAMTAQGRRSPDAEEREMPKSA